MKKQKMSEEAEAEEKDRGKMSKILCGVLLGLGGSTVVLLGWLFVTHLWRPLVASPLPTARHVAVELMGREEYHFTFESDTEMSMIQGQKQLNKTLGQYSSFSVRQLGKDELGSQFRFQLNELILKQSGRIASKTDPVLEKLLTSVDHTKMYEEEYPAYLSKVLEGHSFLARLGHQGEILERFPTNVVMTMTHAADRFVDEVLKKEPNLDRARVASLKRELHTDLLEIGQEVVEEIQEAVYPYMQASPSSIISVGSTWQRSSAEGLIPMSVVYKLVQVYTGKFRPVVTGVKDVSYTRQFAQSDSPRDKTWLIVSVSSHEDINFPLPPSPSPPTPIPTPAPTSKNRTAGNNATDNIEQSEAMPPKALLVLEYLDAMVPPQFRHEREFHMAGINVRLEGMLIVGATTGVVLDGWTVLTTNARIELLDHEQFLVSTRGTDRIRGQVKLQNSAV